MDQWRDDLSRRVQHYGWRYDYRARAITPDMHIGALPAWLSRLAHKIYDETGLFDRVAGQVIVNEHLPGQGIATHIDHPGFGPTVCTIGMNQSREYPAGNVPHQRRRDAPFNRNGESCRGLYNETAKGKPSPTRQNTDGLVARLKQQNIHNILETNVIRYSTRMSEALSAQAHAGGANRGEEIFRCPLAEIAPTLLIVHGAGTAKHISTILKINRLRVPGSADETCDVQTEQRLIIPIRSLAPPEANRWASRRGGYLNQVAIRVRHKLSAQCPGLMGPR